MAEYKERQRYFVTAEIASYCGVTNDGVLRWIKAGKLTAFSTPGGHYRIRPGDFRRFLGQFNIPVNEKFFDKGESKRTVLVVDNERGIREARRALDRIDPDLKVETARDGYSAGIKAGIVRPDVIVVRIMLPRIDGLSLFRSIRENPQTRHARIMAITEFPDECHVKKICESGADRCLVKPLDVDRLTEEIRKLLGEPQVASSRPMGRIAASPVPPG